MPIAAHLIQRFRECRRVPLFALLPKEAIKGCVIEVTRWRGKLGAVDHAALPSPPYFCLQY